MSNESNGPTDKWECHACTFNNEDNEAEACMICGTPRRGKTGAKNCLSKRDVFLPCDSPPKQFQDSISHLDFSPAKQFQESISHLDFSASSNSTKREGDSISNLCHMSFAAWEDDRQAWTCKLCTFENGPRYLVCGGCGVEEGASNVVKDVASIIKDATTASKPTRTTLRSSQKHVTRIINEELESHWESKLKLEEVEELNDVKRDADSETAIRKNLSNIE